MNLINVLSVVKEGYEKIEGYEDGDFDFGIAPKATLITSAALAFLLLLVAIFKAKIMVQMDTLNDNLIKNAKPLKPE